MLIWIVVAILFVVALALFVFIRKRRNQIEGPFSIVLLLRSPTNITEEIVASAFQRAYGYTPQMQAFPMPDGGATGFVGLSESHPTIAVIQAHRPYFEAADLPELRDSVENPVLRSGLTDHTCWIGIDAMGVPSAPKDLALNIHKHLARLAAEFYDENCLLLFLRVHNRFAAPGEYVETKLRQGRIEELFGDDELHAPMFNIDGDDPQLVAARQQAVARLPEFLDACRQRPDDSNAMFKVGFPTSSGQDEFIWLSFSTLEGNQITGEIANEPVDPKVPRKGESVTVATDRIVDWAYTNNDELPHGLFIDRVLMSRSR